MDSRSALGLAGPVTLSSIKAGVQALRTIRAFNYATLTLLLWDMVLTLPTEIAVVWSAPLSVVKVLFLTNRYLTPAFVILHLWTFSGLATGLNNTSCRVIYSIVTVAEITCISAVSLVILLRLYALYEVSRRAFYSMLIFWFITLMAVGALLITNFWLNLDLLVYVPSANICLISMRPNAWTQWVPRLIEHGIFCLFLIFNAMSTLRTAQTRMLAIIYRDGIAYYGFTFSILLVTLLLWRFSGPLYIGMTMFSVGLFLTMATSRLLLSMKTSDTMRRESNLEHLGSIQPQYRRPLPSFQKIARYYHKSDDGGDDDYSSGTFHIQIVGKISVVNNQAPTGGDIHEASNVATVRSHEAFLKKRVWWLFGVVSEKTIIETWVDIGQINDSEEPMHRPTGVQFSRLGRFDDWL